MPEYLVFGRDDEFDVDGAWWPLWSAEKHQSNTPENVLGQIRERLQSNGEEQYVELAAIPKSAFHVEPMRVASGV